MAVRYEEITVECERFITIFICKILLLKTVSYVRDSVRQMHIIASLKDRWVICVVEAFVRVVLNFRFMLGIMVWEDRHD